MIARLARRLRRHRDDAGFSLMEVMVGAALMSVVMAVATSGFITMYQTSDKADTGALAQTELSASFNKLDREVRYAYRVNEPFVTGNDFAVTYVIPDADGAPLCVQLNLPVAGGTLLRSQWVPAANNAPGGTGLTTSAIATSLVSGVTAASDPTQKLSPFIRKVADADGNLNRLQLKVDSTIGVGDKGSVRNYDLTFTALNTVSSDTVFNCVKP